MSYQVYGIRHHGPGSARSLLRALAEQQPDILLIEGPPEADQIVQLAASMEMKPPVAILVYVPDQLQKSVVFPFAVFSPEWQALQHGLSHCIPIRFFDLPQSIQLAMDDDRRDGQEIERRIEGDPRTSLARAGGYEDGEHWWEETIELRRDTSSIFDAISEAIVVLREESGPASSLDQMREAAMRRQIRQAIGDGFSKIAVICGAWHAPALADLETTQSEDTLLLKGLKKIRTAVTWTPWTNARLASSSGYGAGITSPGWYQHLWEENEGITEKWMIKAARLLRTHDLDSSPSHVIEASRLAETLASLRGRHLPDLDEMNDAVMSVFSFGSTLPMRLIHRELTVGDLCGAIPSETPMVPLQADLNRLQKELRLPPQTAPKSLDLDLRKPGDREKSYLFHRCGLIGIPWAVPEKAGGAKGTFHEHWRLQWHADFVMLIIEASPNGNTVAEAASNLTITKSLLSNSLSELTGLLEKAVFADLPVALQHVLERTQNESAVVSDIAHMMDSLPSLIHVGRYGNVRRTDAAAVRTIAASLAGRISIGLTSAVVSLDDQSAKSMSERISLVSGCIGQLESQEIVETWFSAITRLSNNPLAHGFIAGRSCRILLDAGRIDRQHCSESMRRSLSAGSDHSFAAHWLEGFIEDNGYLLLVDNQLWEVIDSWLMSVPEDLFPTILPLIRRTFSTFSLPERRKIYDHVRYPSGSLSQQGVELRVYYSETSAAAPIPLLSKMLGLSQEEIEAQF